MAVLIWAAVAVAVLVGVGLLVRRAQHRRDTQRLRERFGPEYDRILEERRSRRHTEAELFGRMERRRGLSIQPLSAAARERYADSWADTQRRFVDDPVGAVGQGDRLIGSLMQERGYPVEDFEQRAADVSVDHPNVVSNYRAAHDISERSGRNAATTEELRRAMIHYRSLFDELLGVAVSGDGREPAPERLDAPDAMTTAGGERSGR
jgi:hypothetical protein